MFDRIHIFFTRLTKTALVTVLFGYLGWHLVNGSNGILSYLKEKNRLEQTNFKFQVIEENRDKLKNKVEKLYPQSLDTDLLDEQYRRVTGRIKPNEFIYFYEN